MTALRTPAPIRGALAGLVAGLVASYAMDRFQALAATLVKPASGGGDPSTVKAADAVSTAVTGTRVDDDHRRAAGNAVHYVTGAALGMLYGVAAEYHPEVTRGFGTGFGTTTAAVLDEGIVPALGLSASPRATPPATHAYAAASHWVFGATAELTRRALRGR
jgi:hypothetical protein